ncbi:hypothetical protein I3842_03G172700 [Carya illinoinensis]|uniref:Uncharacterized protein n=1 Tax=Carya illinoinensis TaxID=32201 RepID=A0A922JW89_CARIL|nr:hypothetical protein I3842_03G172700 [Carya illinoinensis]
MRLFPCRSISHYVQIPHFSFQDLLKRTEVECDLLKGCHRHI